VESHTYIVEDAKDIVNPALSVLFYTSQFTRLLDTYDDNTYNEVQAFHFFFPEEDRFSSDILISSLCSFSYNHRVLFQVVKSRNL